MSDSDDDDLQFYHRFVARYATQSMLLPRHFATIIGQIQTPTNMVLKEPNGRCWTITIECDQIAGWFTTGWTTFVTDMQLEDNDLLRFRYENNHTFSIYHYDQSHITGMARNGIRVSFEGKIHQSNLRSKKPYMHIAKSFSTALHMTQRSYVKLKGFDCYLYPVKIKSKHHGQGTKTVVMTDGWEKYAAAHKLRVGNRCKFNFAYGTGRISDPFIIHVYNYAV